MLAIFQADVRLPNSADPNQVDNILVVKLRLRQSDLKEQNGLPTMRQASSSKLSRSLPPALACNVFIAAKYPRVILSTVMQPVSPTGCPSPG